MVVCVCYNVSDDKLKAAIADGYTKENIAEYMGCTTNCGSCEGTIEQMLDDHEQKTVTT